MSLIEKMFRKHNDPAGAKKAAGGHAALPDAPLPPPAQPRISEQRSRVAADSNPQDIKRLIEEFSQIESVLTSDEPEESPGHETRLMLPFAEILKVLPQSCRASDEVDPGLDQKVQVLIGDLYSQLGRGKVVVRLVDLLTDVPERYLAADFSDHLEDPVTLPLPLLVQHIPADQLEQHQPRQEREPDLASLPDIFGPDSHSEKQVTDTGLRVPTPHPEEGASDPAGDTPEHEDPHPVLAEDRMPAEEPVQEPPPPEDLTPTEESPLPEIMLHGVDLNRAPVRALRKALPGVGHRLAERLCAARPFRSVYDLERVQGIGPRAFRSITGHARPAGKDAVDRLLTILSSDDAAVRPLPRDAAQRIAAMRGVRGCIISHCEGHLLAAAWRKPPVETVSALAPQILKNMQRHMDDLKMKNATSLLVLADPYPLCLVQAKDLILTLCLSRSAFSVRRLEFFEALAWELVRRLHAHSTELKSGSPQPRL